MTTVLVTGARGFIGRHLVDQLARDPNQTVLQFDVENTDEELRTWASSADIVFHLAGVNRPVHVEEFESGNAGLTQRLCDVLKAAARSPHVILSSSIQAERDNPYGSSKRHAEQILQQFREATDARVSIFRLKNVFGPGCRPNYNSVTATFCHNIAHDLPVQISDPNYEFELVHVEDVVNGMIAEATKPSTHGDDPAAAIPSYRITLGDLAGRIQCFREMQQTLTTPDFSIRFNQQLYSTYLSYVPAERWEYGLEIRRDDRGSLAEFIKSQSFGQIFVSRTKPGITRGNHYHQVKAEKFVVLSGEGLIRFRPVGGTEILEFRVRGEDYRVVEIPPKYTHNITNVGSTEMITLFWSSEIFDPDRPDTYFQPVENS